MCMNKLTDAQREIIDDAYHAWMDGNATPQQELIWRFSNSLFCMYTWQYMDDVDVKIKIQELLEVNI